MTITITGEITAAQDLSDNLVVERTGIVRAGPTAITTSDGHAIKIFGSVYGTAGAISAGTFAQLSIGSSGLVHSESTVVTVGSEAVVHNAGQISTLGGRLGTGIQANGSNHAITNTGSIEAYFGIRADMSGWNETINNTGTILSSGGVGIEVNGAGWIINGGTIQSVGGSASGC
jgi:serralysin